jgi:hypothetical protein
MALEKDLIASDKDYSKSRSTETYGVSLGLICPENHGTGCAEHAD